MRDQPYEPGDRKRRSAHDRARDERTCHWRIVFESGHEVIVAGATKRRAVAAAGRAGAFRGRRGRVVAVEHACQAGCRREQPARALDFS